MHYPIESKKILKPVLLEKPLDMFRSKPKQTPGTFIFLPSILNNDSCQAVLSLLIWP
jgi:hypothetical protein